MVNFADARRSEDKRYIAHRSAEGLDAHYKAGEFAAREISMAVTLSKRTAERTAAMSRRLQAEAPDAWDAWRAGDIDQEKAVRINRALRLLVSDRSKQFLNNLVVDVAICRTPEILGRWLNQFVARVEPDETDERLNRSLDDRYVSIRPDLNGVSFLFAAMSAVDANAVDQVLTALAAAADPEDLRTLQQRRADALVDVLLGRVSNGCHVYWDTNDDSNDHLDDGDDGGFDQGTRDRRGDTASDPDETEPDDRDIEPIDCNDRDHDEPRDGVRNERDHGESDVEDEYFCKGGHDELRDGDCDGSDHNEGYQTQGDDNEGDHDEGDDNEGSDDEGSDNEGDQTQGNHDEGDHDEGGDQKQGNHDEGDDKEGDQEQGDHDEGDAREGDDDEGVRQHSDDNASTLPPRPESHPDTTARAWDAGDWELPASAFRPDPRATPPEPEGPRATALDADVTAVGRARIAPCPVGGHPRPLPVTVGVVVSMQSLFGYSNAPGQLADRSALVPADRIRDLAAQPGTLFYRLLTDELGNLLDVTEMGRFPSRKLGAAVRFRGGVCDNPACTVPAARCDLDHMVPVPDGPTTATKPGPEMQVRPPGQDTRGVRQRPYRTPHVRVDDSDRS